MTTIITTVPSRASPSTFAADGDACLAQMAALSQDINTLSTNLTAAVDSVSAGLAASTWSTGMSVTQYVTRVFSRADGLLYLRTGATGTSTVDPASDLGNWVLLTLPAGPLVVVSSTTQTGVKGQRYVMANTGASEFTVPASPSVGDRIPLLAFPNGRVDNYVRRNGSLLMGRSEDMLVNIPYWARALDFVGGAYGWVVAR